MKKKRCKERYCHKEAKKHGRCWFHDNAYYRSKNPVRYAYQTLKDNAKRRGKTFLISLEYFKQFCKRTDYIAGKGRMKESYSVDCIDPRKGYVEGNLQCITLSDNTKKMHSDKKILSYDYVTGTAFVTKLTAAEQEYDMPF